MTKFQFSFPAFIILVFSFLCPLKNTIGQCPDIIYNIESVNCSNGEVDIEFSIALESPVSYFAGYDNLNPQTGTIVADCIAISPPSPFVCPTLFWPVCGCDGNTYANGSCAELFGITEYTDGECDGTIYIGYTLVDVISGSETTINVIYIVDNGGIEYCAEEFTLPAFYCVSNPTCSGNPLDYTWLQSLTNNWNCSSCPLEVYQSEYIGQDIIEIKYPNGCNGLDGIVYDCDGNQLFEYGNNLNAEQLQFISTGTFLWDCSMQSSSCDRQRDSLALVDLYNDTDGANWSNKWFLNQSLDSWYGVCLNDAGCVETLDLDGVADCDFQVSPGGNNLSGILPVTIGDLRNLKNIYLTDNPMVGGSIPDTLFTIPHLKRVYLDNMSLEGTVSANMQNLDSLVSVIIDHNYFTFEDLLPIVPFLETISSDYAPQASIYPDTVFNKVVGESLLIDLGIDASVPTNRYNWFKNNQLLPNMPLSANSFSIGNVTFNDAGTYRCEVSNPNAPDLILETGTITLNVDNCTVPVAISPDPASICPNQTIELDAGAGFVLYEWSNGDNGQTTAITSSGIYRVTVTDAVGCTGSDQISVFQQNSNCDLEVTVAQLTSPPCSGDAAGVILIDVLNGTAPYDYVWSNGTTDNPVSGLLAGTYAVTVTDVTGLEGTASVVVPEPDALAVSIDALDCPGNGKLTAVPNGGVSPYDFIWSNGETTATVFNLTAGQYCVTLTDDNDCEEILCENITAIDSEPPAVVCLSDITISIEPDQKVSIMAVSLDNGSSDNCSVAGDLQFGFSSNIGDESLTFDCNDIGPNTVTLWVTDEEDNQNQCANLTTVTVNDPAGNCISPCLLDFSAQEVNACMGNEDVYLELIVTPSGMSSSFMVEGNGVNYGVFEYANSPVTIGPVTGMGQVLDVIVTDIGSSTCIATESIPLSDCPDVPCVHPDKAALKALYENTDGENWTTIVWDTSSCNVCAWIGVGCENDRVTTLSLENNGLAGNIPYAIGGLTELKELFLSGNSLSGGLPSSIGSFANLEKLYLSNNAITGSIHSWYAGLGNLQELLLNNNQLDGTIQSEVGDMVSLQRLDLSNNSLNGSIPSNIEGLTNLKYLSLAFNQLSGTIPDNLGFLSALDTFYLNNNNLEGCIHNELLNLCSNGTVGDFSNNPDLDNDDWETFCIGEQGICPDTNPCPIADDCDCIIDLGVGTNCNTQEVYSNINATESNIGSDNFPTCFYDDPHRDVWFKFVAEGPPGGGNVNYSITISGTGIIPVLQPQVAIYIGDCGIDEFQYLDCASADVGESEVSIDLIGLIGNITYFIRINDWSANAAPNWGEFTICIEEYDCSIPVTAIDSTLCNGGSITVGGTVYDENNPIGMDTIEVNGCDSVINVDLSFHEEFVFDLNETLCSGSSITVNGVVYDENNPTGMEVDTSVNGCDSTINVSLNFDDIVEATLDPVLCSGESIVVNGTIYDENNKTGEETFPNGSVLGCDSIVAIYLTFYDATYSINDLLCAEASITVNGTVYDIDNPQGTETLLGESLYGCDSIINIGLSFYDEAIFNVNDTICIDGSITVNGTVYDIGNSQGTDTLYGQSIHGCDSIINVDLSFILGVADEFIEATICNGEEYDFNGVILTETGLYFDTLQSFIGGCDSVQYLLDLNVVEPSVIEVENDEYLLPVSTIQSLIDVTENDVLPEYWSLQLPQNTTATSQSVSDAGNGNVLYKLVDPDFVGIDSFQYQICQTDCPDDCAAATVTVIVDSDCIEQALKNAPKAFSPNSSAGINDEFDPLGLAIETECPSLDLETVEFKIINGWGEVVFEPEGYEAWSHENDPRLVKMPPATYYYLIRIEGVEEIKEGVISIYER